MRFFEFITEATYDPNDEDSFIDQYKYWSSTYSFNQGYKAAQTNPNAKNPFPKSNNPRIQSLRDHWNNGFRQARSGFSLHGLGLGAGRSLPSTDWSKFRIDRGNKSIDSNKSLWNYDPDISSKARERDEQEKERTRVKIDPLANQKKLDWKQILKQTLVGEKVKRDSQVKSLEYERTYKSPNKRFLDGDFIMKGKRRKRIEKSEDDTIKNPKPLDLVIAIDESGSISEMEKRSYLQHVLDIMEDFKDLTFKITVMGFDTQITAIAQYDENNMEEMRNFPFERGGGNRMSSVFQKLQELEIVPKLLLVFSDGDFTDNSNGIPRVYRKYCPTVWAYSNIRIFDHFSNLYRNYGGTFVKI